MCLARLLVRFLDELQNVRFDFVVQFKNVRNDVQFRNLQ